ncbi:MAG TPA: hypothetical protein VHF22_00035 [Planctomycetota bacterium]|nr:hypothetical protein [Planctomycetota bacterium]
MSQHRFLSLSFLAAVALAALPACSVKYRHEVEKPGTPPKYTYSAGGFMRYDGYDDVAGDMEVASREYVNPQSGTRIRLVGAIHIGDIDYYKTLQKEALDTADVVLFEGVKFEGNQAPPDLGGVYSSMGQLLGIGFQKDGIDYRARNFVHCDITVKEGDPLFQTIDPAQVNQAAQMLQPLASMKAMMTAGGDAKRTEDALKHGMVTIMAMQMGGDDDGAAIDQDKALEKLGAGGADNPLRKRAEKAFDALKKTGGLQLPGMSEGMKKEVLERRNTYVLEQLKARLDADGPEKRQTIAVFYGAAHLPGMEREIESWGWRPVETVWFRAWRMNSHGGKVLAERIAETGVAAEAAPRKGLRAPGRRKQPTLF